MNSTWHPDARGILYDDGDTTFGDDQAGGAWSVRLVRDDVPAAFIQVTSGVTLNRADRFSPEAQVEYLTGTDPQDLPGTETFSGYAYDNDHAFDYETPQEALPAAEEIIRYYAAYGGELFTWWDGTEDGYRSAMCGEPR